MPTAKIEAIDMLKVLGMSTDPKDMARELIRKMPISKCKEAILSLTDPDQLMFIISEMGTKSYETVLQNPHCDKDCLEAMWDGWQTDRSSKFLRDWAMHPNVDRELSEKKSKDIANYVIGYQEYIKGRLLNTNVSREEVLQYWDVLCGSMRPDIIVSKALTNEDCFRLVSRGSAREVLQAFAERMHVDA